MSIAQSCMKLATGEANDNGLDEYQPPKTRKKAKAESAENVNSNNTRAHEDVAPGEFAIREDKRNYRKHSEQNLKLIGNSLKAYGAGRSIVADNSGAVIGGNGTLRQANKLGIKQRIVHTTGDELVVVVRDDIAPDDPRRQELAIMDNSTTDSSEFDFDLLQADFSIPELENFGVIVPDIDLGDGDDFTEGETDPDAVPETPEEPKSKRGEVYQLGKHRLMCGDSTSADDVAKLMNGEKADMVFTDPPYGVSYTGGIQFKDGYVEHNNRKMIFNDDVDIYEDVFRILSQFANGACYIWFAGTKAASLYNAAEKYGEIHALIIWVKNGGYGALNANYKQKHEPCLYWKPNSCKLNFCGPTTETTIWEIQKDGVNEYHPTQKPVALPAKAIRNHEANTVLDLFGGSGSTLIACEQTQRQCRMMELDEHYCDVIRKRWAEFVHGEGCDWEKLTEVC